MKVGVGNRFFMSMYVLVVCLATTACSSSKKISESKTKQKTASTHMQVVLKRYADQMNVSVSSLENPELYLLVDEWIGVPYKYAGASKAGTDCSGLVNSIYKKFTSQPLPRSSAELSKVINPVNKSKLREGDLVFFNYDGKSNSHVGIYLQNGFFVHASSMKGVIISDLKSDYYKRRLSKGGPLRTGSLRELKRGETR